MCPRLEIPKQEAKQPTQSQAVSIKEPKPDMITMCYGLQNPAAISVMLLFISFTIN